MPLEAKWDLIGNQIIFGDLVTASLAQFPLRSGGLVYFPTFGFGSVSF